MKLKNKGFTLIELLAVIAIIAILATISVVIVEGTMKKANTNLSKIEKENVKAVAKAYVADNLDTINSDLKTMGCYTITAQTLENEGYIILNKDKTYGDLIVTKVNNKIKVEYIDDLESEVTCTPLNEIANENSNEVQNPPAEEEPTTTVKIYGVRRGLTNNTSSSWDRMGESNTRGLMANAIKSQSDLENGVRNDFDNIYPWSEIKSYNYNVSNNTVTAWIGDSNFKFDGSNGEVLTYIPEFYYKRYVEQDHEYMYIADGPVEGYTRSSSFSVGRYMMDEFGHSASGNALSRLNHLGTSRNLVHNYLGTSFGIMDWRYFLVQMLYLVEYADYDSQKKLGYGHTGNMLLNDPTITGETDSLSMKSGTLNNDYAHSMIYRGIEDIYGNDFEWIDGILLARSGAGVKVYISYNSAHYSDSEIYGYQELSYKPAVSHTSDRMGYDPNNSLIGFPLNDVNAPDVTGDRYDFQYKTGTYYESLAVGGGYDDRDGAGLWNYSCGNPGYNLWEIPDFGAARVIKY